MRDSMRDQCSAIFFILMSGKANGIGEIAGALHISARTVRRWLDSFSKVLDLRVEKGVVILCGPSLPIIAAPTGGCSGTPRPEIVDPGGD